MDRHGDRKGCASYEGFVEARLSKHLAGSVDRREARGQRENAPRSVVCCAATHVCRVCQVGKIVKVWRGICTELFTDADSFEVLSLPIYDYYYIYIYI